MKHKSDRIMSIKLVVGVEVLNVICVYAPQVGLTNDIKRVGVGGSHPKFTSK